MTRHCFKAAVPSRQKSLAGANKIKLLRYSNPKACTPPNLFLSFFQIQTFPKNLKLKKVIFN